MGIDNTYIPNVKEINGYLIYKEAQDFHFTITQKDALDKLFISADNQYCWRPWQMSNYYLVITVIRFVIGFFSWIFYKICSHVQVLNELDL